MLTFLPLEQIDEMDSWEGAKLNEAKDILAYELTKLVHGEEEAEKARSASKAMFGGNKDASMLEAVIVSDEQFDDGKVDILSLLVITGQCQSRSEARRAIEKDNSVSVNDEKISDIKTSYTKDDLSGDGIVIKKGKKSFKKVTI